VDTSSRLLPTVESVNKLQLQWSNYNTELIFQLRVLPKVRPELYWLAVPI